MNESFNYIHEKPKTTIFSKSLFYSASLLLEMLNTGSCLDKECHTLHCHSRMRGLVREFFLIVGFKQELFLPWVLGTSLYLHMVGVLTCPLLVQ